MKKIIIKESQKERLFEDVNVNNTEEDFNVSPEEFNISPEDFKYFGMDFSKHPGLIDAEYDDSEDEDDFFANTLELLGNGAQAFDNLKNYYIEHPYAINNAEKLKAKLSTIEKIIDQIQELYL